VESPGIVLVIDFGEKRVVRRQGGSGQACRRAAWFLPEPDASYSFLNRTIAYDFAALPNVSAVNTSISVLPVLPRNKAIGTATLRLPHQILAIVNERYESGLVVQDTTYATTSPFFLPHSESYATTDLGVIAPIRAGVSVQAGVKNLFDRNYFYTAGYPEIGRNCFLNFRYRF
jgi:iron complex outermembrane receptor protein